MSRAIKNILPEFVADKFMEKLSDEEKEKIWQIIASLPKVCAFEPYRIVKLYMEEQCMSILKRREDIRFGDYLWRRVRAWRTRPYCYWLKQKIKIGIPMKIKTKRY